MMNRFLAAAVVLIVLVSLQAGSELDPENRWQIRDYYNSVYLGADTAEIGWSGDYATGHSGTVSLEWQAATKSRVNYFRNMSGISNNVSFDPALANAVQQAALMMSAAGQLNHFPESSWPWYTVEAGNAAQKSNLALGTSGPDAITGYINDFGTSNSNVGHRRWLLYPQTSVMGNGDVPGDVNQGLQPANALWVVPEAFEERPATRDEFVAWPPRGHVPANLVFARWSLAHPDADFSAASVSMKAGDQSIPVQLEPVDTRFIGEPTLVWVPDGMDSNSKAHWPVPEADEAITVTVADVLINGSATTFTYTVRIFDPELAGEAEFPAAPEVTGPVIPTVPTRFAVSSREWADGVQGRIISAQSYHTVHGAEEGLTGFEADLSDGYSGIQINRVASGSAAFQLATPDHTKAQYLELKDEFIIWPGPAELSFASSLAWATENQAASVQINTGSGDAWQTIWTRRGPIDANNAFSSESVDLTPWEGKTARFRFCYKVDGLGSYWANLGGNSGWAIDNIALTGISRVTGIEELPPNTEDRSITLTVDDTATLYLQARDLAFGGRPLDWGPIREINPEWHRQVLASEGQWTEDPVIGWNFGGLNSWTYVLNLGWTYVANFPWIYTSDGWFRYLQGSIQTGLWLHNASHGTIYTSYAFGNWFQRAPYNEASWRQFGG